MRDYDRYRGRDGGTYDVFDNLREARKKDERLEGSPRRFL